RAARGRSAAGIRSAAARLPARAVAPAAAPGSPAGGDSGPWRAPPRPPGTPAAARSGAAPAGRAPPRAARRASQIICDDVLQRGVVERQLAQQLLQLAILVFQLLEAAQLAHLQPAVLRLPAVVGRVADPVLAADVGARAPALDL